MFRFLIPALLFLSCGNENAQKEQIKTDSTVDYRVPLAIDEIPLAEGADSVQLLYFDDPYGDSIKYTRFFSFYNSADTSFLFALKEQLQQEYRLEDKVDSCRSEGKIYLFHQEQPVKTFYFSTDCSCSCFIYFIKDGRFYYLKPTEKIIELLKLNKSKARKN